MNEALTKKLLDDFPRLFRDRNESAMQRGFECGDGWFDLIYKLAQDIEAVARESGLSSDSTDWPKCRQVKAKMGSLRFVIFAVQGQSEMNERISEFRTVVLNQSLSICEYCDTTEITPLTQSKPSQKNINAQLKPYAKLMGC